MQLDYRKTRSGLYILKKEDFDDIAFMVLKEYQPIMLTKAQPLDVDDFIYERLFLDMKTARLSVDGRILGVIAFDDTTYDGFDSYGRPIEIHMPVGTILLEESLMNDPHHVGRQRFTKMHEASHWICHRQYHVPLEGRNYEFRVKDDTRSIACRMERIEHPGQSEGASRKWSDIEWEEWQADNMAAALLMPKVTFIQAVREVMASYGIYDGNPLYWENDLTVSHRIVDDLKSIYNVSKSAVELRMVRCGLLVRENC